MSKLRCILILSVLAIPSLNAAELTKEIYLMEFENDWEFGTKQRGVLKGKERDLFVPCNRNLAPVIFSDSAGVQNGMSSCPDAETIPDHFSDDTILASIRSRGMLNCGVRVGEFGFAEVDADGVWSGFDVGFCRALAAAVLGDDENVQIFPLTENNTLTTLLSGEIDVLARNSLPSSSIIDDLNLEMAAVNYYDGQGFFLPERLGIDSAIQLDNVSVCVRFGTTDELNVANFYRSNNISYRGVPITNEREAAQFLSTGRCDVYSGQVSTMASMIGEIENPQEYQLLPEIISLEPLGPVVRSEDGTWGDIVRLTSNALILAEELGLTANDIASNQNVASEAQFTNLLQAEGSIGEMFDLEENWARNAIMAGGNYGELFEESFGERSHTGLARGQNAQWTDGGLIYSPPFR